MSALDRHGAISATHEHLGFELTVAIVAWLERLNYHSTSIRAGMIRALAAPPMKIEGNVGEPAFRAFMIAMLPSRTTPDSARWLAEHALSHVDGDIGSAIERLLAAADCLRDWPGAFDAE